MGREHGESSSAKRRKLDSGAAAPVEPQDVHSVHDLRNFLRFDQSLGPTVKIGLINFKNYLNAIAAAEATPQRAKQLEILKSYCDAQYSVQEEGKPAVCFPDLTKTWSLAEGANNEALLSMIPSVFALFLKTASHHLDFKEFGIALCKHLLQGDQLRLFNRALTATKTKEHVIAPILRLLTEMTTFDAGAVARLVYARQDITFKRLDVLLGLQKEKPMSAEEEKKKPSLRRLAQRYLLAHLKFQDFVIKSEIITQGKIVRAFLQDIRHDSRDIILDIIKTIEKSIINDPEISRRTKSHTLNHWNLTKFATLYGYEKDAEDPQEGELSVTNAVHKFLMSVCFDPEKGVLSPETGWYPSGNNPDSAPSAGKDLIELGLESPLYLDNFRDNVPVKNVTLSSFTQILRPETDTLQMELLLKIFTAAPELVAHYFTKRRMFTSDPKPVASWFGEGAFLFSTVQLPVPRDCGWKDGKPTMPPPVSIVIESIMPRPCTQKVLTRCLNQNNDIVSLFAVRLTTTAFQKLESVQKVFQSAPSESNEFWAQALQKLVEEFCRRCPKMKDVITLFRRSAKDDLDLQVAVAELLAKYYKVTPSLAMEEKFDVSMVLLETLGRIEAVDDDKEQLESLLSLLSHLLDIAEQSPNMQWWKKPEALKFTPFTTILKVLASTEGDDSQEQIQELLQTVMLDSGFLHQSASYEALIASLRIEAGKAPSDAVFAFLDNCFTRLVKYPVLYQEKAQSFLKKSETKLSPLLATIHEQWSFVVKVGNADAENAVAEWISGFIAYISKAGEDKHALEEIRDDLKDGTSSKTSRSFFKGAFKKDVSAFSPAETEQKDEANTPSKSIEIKETVDLDNVLGSLPIESESHPELQRWEKEDIDAVVTDGHLGKLMLCLCSQYPEIRIQAASALRRFMAKLQESSYQDWQSIYILTGEILETFAVQPPNQPLPYIAAEVALHSAVVLSDPTSKLYAKVNKFLQKAPVWNVEKLVSYWSDKVFLNEPEVDDAQWVEIGWFIDVLGGGLRSQRDMDLYRQTGIFERLLALYTNPTTPRDLRTKILSVIYRATQVDGSTSLITRSAIVSWIQMRLASPQEGSKVVLRSLAESIWEKRDKEWVGAWGGEDLQAAALVL